MLTLPNPICEWGFSKGELDQLGYGNIPVFACRAHFHDGTILLEKNDVYNSILSYNATL